MDTIDRTLAGLASAAVKKQPRNHTV